MALPYNQTPTIHIVSPFLHLTGHYRSYTLDLSRALHAHAPSVTIVIHIAQGCSKSCELPKSKHIQWKTCAPWFRYLLPNRWRQKWWGTRIEHLLRNIEFYCCLRSATQLAKQNGQGHIHCIESCHRTLLRAVVHSKQSFSTLCVGSPGTALSSTVTKAYLLAFATGRLNFIVETEDVRKSWAGLAGKHVMHIPAAIPFGAYIPLSRGDARIALKLPKDSLICLFFGTHRLGKNYRLAIEAAKLSESKPYLLFVGPLISDNDPGNLLKELHYPNGESWEGYYPEQHLSTLFDACDAVILPYRAGYDKGSGVLLQACQYLKPLIATNTGHLADFINSNQVGFLFEATEPRSLANTFDHFANLSPENLQILKSQLAITRDVYSWNMLINQYLVIFQKNNFD